MNISVRRAGHSATIMFVLPIHLRSEVLNVVVKQRVQLLVLLAMEMDITIITPTAPMDIVMVHHTTTVINQDMEHIEVHQVYMIN